MKRGNEDEEKKGVNNQGAYKQLVINGRNQKKNGIEMWKRIRIITRNRTLNIRFSIRITLYGRTVVRYFSLFVVMITKVVMFVLMIAIIITFFSSIIVRNIIVIVTVVNNIICYSFVDYFLVCCRSVFLFVVEVYSSLLQRCILVCCRSVI